MAETSKKWARRVAAWRASGLSSTEFCSGRDYSAGGLRYWAHQLKKQGAAQESPAPAVRLARVVRAPGPQEAAQPSPAEGERQSCARATSPSLVVETQGVSIGVPPGFDAATLASVLDVLESRGHRGGLR